MRVWRTIFFVISGVIFFSGNNLSSFKKFKSDFEEGYEKLHIPGFTFDYRDYFSAIPSLEELAKQLQFFQEQAANIKKTDRNSLDKWEKAEYDQLIFEMGYNLERVNLETEWAREGRVQSLGGLHQLHNYSAWYSFFVKRFTSLDLKAEQVFELGKKEVARVKTEIKKISGRMDFKDSAAFYSYLKKDDFFFTDKAMIISEFEKTDSIVRSHLTEFVGKNSAAPLNAMEWPQAGRDTPPGIYLSSSENAYGKDVFLFNFYGGKFNKRALEWLYMHEGIPGHHLQSSFRKTTAHPSSLNDFFIYPGNFEGWACYVEYFGKDLGLFKDPYSELGKWEWDLVRSARLVLDAGIHYYGWTHEQALAYWKTTIPGQDDIAEREVTRVTNWAGQTVSYKAGADFIFRLRERWLQKNPGKSAKDFHHAYLETRSVPLTVIEKNIL